MDLTGEHRIPASKDAVWRALNDPDVLKVAIPGCETVEKKSDTEFSAKVTLKVGPVKAKFAGEVTLSDMDPPNGYTITGKGSGGAAGFGKGSAQITLTEDGGDTVLAYTAQASVGGKLAQVGQRLIDATAKKLAEQFFAGFVQYLEETGVAAAPAPAPEAAPEAAQRGPGIWVAAAIVAAILIYWFVFR